MNLDIREILSETDRDPGSTGCHPGRVGLQVDDPVCVVTGTVPPEQFDSEPLPGDFRYEGPITITINSRRTSDQEIVLDIRAEIRYSMECARCAGRSIKNLSLAELVVYFGAPGDASSGVGKIVHDEEEFSLAEFMLFDELRQKMELAIPLKFLCDAACRGLCPVCGENRNQTDCGHVPAAADTIGARLGLFKTGK